MLEAVCAKVRLGEVSRARQLMTSSGIAPGTAETLAELRDPDLRPPRLTAAIPEEVLSFRPARRLVLDRAKLARSVQSARRGSAADLSGTRPEHFKTLLDDEDVWDMFCDMSEAFANAEAPDCISEALALGRLTALRKPNGRVRGIVAGAVWRRCVGRALSMQFSDAFATTTAPFQFALQTRAGTDAVGHALRVITDSDPNAVVISLDGIGAFDHIRRSAILTKMGSKPALADLVPYVRLFYSRQSRYLWRDDEGTVHDILQGEGGEQGDALMPALYSTGQHSGLEAAAGNLHPGERLFSFLDDLYLITTRERARAAIDEVTQTIEHHCGVRSHMGKLRAWCRGGPARSCCLGPGCVDGGPPGTPQRHHGAGHAPGPS